MCRWRQVGDTRSRRGLTTAGACAYAGGCPRDSEWSRWGLHVSCKYPPAKPGDTYTPSLPNPRLRHATCSSGTEVRPSLFRLAAERFRAMGGERPGHLSRCLDRCGLGSRLLLILRAAAHRPLHLPICVERR